VDAGLSGRETFKRLKALDDRNGDRSNERVEEISAILITHEHSDHVAGLQRLATKLNVPVFLTAPTHHAWSRAVRDEKGAIPDLPKLEHFSAGRGFRVGDIEVMPFTIPHDAADPVGFTFRAEGVKIGFATDLGYMPTNVRNHLRGCSVLVMESNHDVEMLRSGPYPWSVKQMCIRDRSTRLQGLSSSSREVGPGSFSTTPDFPRARGNIWLQDGSRTIGSRWRNSWRSHPQIGSQNNGVQQF